MELFVNMGGSRKFCQRGSNFDIAFFKLFTRGSIQINTTISGSSSSYQRNAIKWRFSGVLMMAQH